MAIPARPEPADLRMAWVHTVLAALCLVLVVAAIATLNTGNWERRLATTGFFAYSMLLHACLAWGLRRGEAWTREGSIEAAMRLLLAFPFGTIIGAVMLAHAWSDGHRTPRPKPRVPLIEAWPEADRVRAARDRSEPGSRD